MPPAVMPPATMPRAREMPKVPEGQPETSMSAPAQVVIKAPADVRILVNGAFTERSATVMTFSTPALKLGKTYAYQVKAQAVRGGQTVVETKEVTVRAGAEAVIDFTDLKAVPVVQAGTTTALVTVNMPADARLFVDGTAYPLPAKQRTFTTPALTWGKDYLYDLKAEVIRDGKTLTATRKVAVEPGKHVTVDFKELDAIQTVSR